MNEVVPFELRSMITDPCEYPDAVFTELMARRGMPLMLHANIGESDAPLTPDTFAGQVIAWSQMADGEKTVVLLRADPEDPAAALIKKHCCGVVALVCARRVEVAQRMLDEIRAAFPQAGTGSTRPSIPIVYWHRSSEGPSHVIRAIGAVSWQEVALNYSQPTRGALAELIASRPTGAGGRLMLWHGAPGTGKTYAIRALASEWREWCRFEYVVDPELLFGGESDYLMGVLLAEDREDGVPDGWRVLVLEDTGELLSIDARQQVGQALSRLLNVSEGLLGQATKLMILVTSNEELGKLNPAVTRPGRCLSQIEFRRFSAHEGNQWLSDSGCKKKIAAPITLAELYGLSAGRGQQSVDSARPVGFRLSESCPLAVKSTQRYRAEREGRQ